MNSPVKVLGALWLAITIPVIGSAWYISNHVTPAPVVVTHTVVVTPTASPSATLVPTTTPKVSTLKSKVVTPTVKGGVK